MVKIPLYNQGLGPVAGLATGSLGPKASTAGEKAVLAESQAIATAFDIAGKFAQAEKDAEAEKINLEESQKARQEIQQIARERTDLDSVEKFNDFAKRYEEKAIARLDNYSLPLLTRRNMELSLRKNMASAFNGGREIAFNRRQFIHSEVANDEIKDIVSKISSGEIPMDVGIAEFEEKSRQFQLQGLNIDYKDTSDFVFDIEKQRITLDIAENRNGISYYNSLASKALRGEGVYENLDVNQRIKISNLATAQSNTLRTKAIYSVKANAEKVLAKVEAGEISADSEEVSLARSQLADVGRPDLAEEFIQDAQGYQKEFEVEARYNHSLEQLSQVHPSQLDDVERAIQQGKNKFEKVVGTGEDAQVISIDFTDLTVAQRNRLIIASRAYAEERQDEVKQQRFQNVSNALLSPNATQESASRFAAGLYDSTSNQDLGYLPPDVDAQIVGGAQAATARLQQQISSGNVDASVLDQIAVIESVLTEPINGRAPLISGDTSYNSTARSQLTKLSSMRTALNKEIKKIQKSTLASKAIASGDYFGPTKRSLNLTEAEEQKAISMSMEQEAQISLAKGEPNGVTIQRQLQILEANGGLPWDDFSEELSLKINSLRNMQEIGSVKEEMIDGLVEVVAALKEFPATFKANVSKDDQDYMNEVLRRSRFETLPESVLNTNSAIKLNLTFNPTAKKIEAALKQVDGFESSVNQAGVRILYTDRVKQLYKIHGNEDLAFTQAAEDVQEQLVSINGSFIIRDRDTPPDIEDQFNASLEVVKLNTEEKNDGLKFDDDDIDLDEITAVSRGNGQFLAITKTGQTLLGVAKDPETGEESIVPIVFSPNEMEDALSDKRAAERRVLAEEQQEENTIVYLDSLPKPQEIDKDLLDMGLNALRREAEKLNIYGEDIGESPTSLRIRIQKSRSREELEAIRDEQDFVRQLDEGPLPEKIDPDLESMDFEDLVEESERLGIADDYIAGSRIKDPRRLRIRIQKYRMTRGAQ